MPMTASSAIHGANSCGGDREEREREAHQAVGAHLQQHAGQDDRAGGGRLHVRVGQPGVEREQRHLDRERDGERQEEPALRVRRDLQRVEPQQVEAVAAGRLLVQEGEPEDGDEHQHAARHRVEHELDRRVDALVVAPDPDEEVHRDEHRVPEHVEQEEIERDEDADHRGFEREDEDRELLDLLLHALPRREQRNRREEAGEHHQQQADAVDADVVVDAEGRDPRHPLDELEVGRRGVEARPDQQGHGKGHERGAERDPADHRVAPAVGVADQGEEDGAGERQRPGQGEEHGLRYLQR